MIGSPPNSGGFRGLALRIELEMRRLYDLSVWAYSFVREVYLIHMTYVVQLGM